MTKVQKWLAEQRKLTRERCEKRARLGELAMKAERSDDEAAEVETIKARLIEIDGRWVELDTAIADEGGPETFARRGEQAELSALFADARMSDVVAHVSGKRSVSGATREMQEHFNVADDAVPLQKVWSASPAARRGENGERFAVTTAPGDVGVIEGEVVLPVTAGSIGAYLAVARPMVESGDYVAPELQTRGSVKGPYSDSTETAETDGTFAAHTLAANRGDVSFVGRATDFARFEGMKGSLEQACRDALDEWLDAQAVAAIVADVGRTNAAAADTYATYLKRLVYDQIDGRHAAQEGDIRLLVGNDALGDMAASYRSNNSDESAAEALRRLTGGVRVSPLIAATAGNKRDVIVRKGTRRDLVQPVWQGIQLLVDELTGRSKGEVTITARIMTNRKVIRAAGFARVQAQHQ